MLSALQLAEPIIAAMVKLLSTNMPAIVDELNATITDGFTVEQPVQYLPYVPVPSTLEGGMPIIGVRELGAIFVDDLQYNTDAVHRYAVMALCQNSDQQSLAWQLRRTAQAIMYTISLDRLLGPAAIMRQSGEYSVNFESTEPGPLYGEPELTDDGIIRPPRSFMSYTAVVFNSRRTEV